MYIVRKGAICRLETISQKIFCLKITFSLVIFRLYVFQGKENTIDHGWWPAWLFISLYIAISLKLHAVK